MSRPAPTWRLLRAVAPLLLGAIIMGPLGCSPGSRFRVASFLFDGVEHPDSVQARAKRDSLRQVRLPARSNVRSGTPQRGDSQVVVNLHPPYEDGDCGVCHDSGERRSFSGNAALVEPVRVLCRDCHDDLSIEELRETYPWVHGPVAAGACNACHNPHQSTRDHLLLADPARDLCLRCHQERRVTDSASHAGLNLKACTECHGPHGWFSRGGKPPPIPASSLDGKGQGE